jgi:hypothetical protein
MHTHARALTRTQPCKHAAAIACTHTQAYGEAAFDHMPRSYLIPQQYWVWRSHLAATGSPPHTRWVLKANVHRCVLAAALAAVLACCARGGAGAALVTPRC